MNQPAEGDKFPLHTAARLTQIHVLESLLTTSPKSTLQVDDDGRLPIHWACTTGNTDVIRSILDASPKRSFDPDAVDSSGWTPLMICASLKDNAGLPAVELLLARDADPKIASNTGATAMHFAASKGNIEIVKHLLANGTSARVKDKRGQLPLHRAAAVGNLPLVRLLLKEGKSPVNATDVDGLTSLHHAISEGHGDVAVELMRQGAETGKKDKDDKLPIDCAPDRTVRQYVLRMAEMEGIDVEGG